MKPILKPKSTQLLNVDFNSDEEEQVEELREALGITKNEMEMHKRLQKDKRKILQQKREAKKLIKSDTHDMMKSLKIQRMKSIITGKMASPMTRGFQR